MIQNSNGKLLEGNYKKYGVNSKDDTFSDSKRFVKIKGDDMIKNLISYLTEIEYEELMETFDERVGCKNRVRNVIVKKEYSNVEFVNFLFQELEIDRIIELKYEKNYDAISDILGDIPGYLDGNIRFINLIFENKDFVNDKMFIVLEDLQEYFSEEIIECGSINDFSLSFDMYIKICVKRIDLWND